MSETVIQVENVGKRYQIYGSPFGRLMERMPWNKHPRHRERGGGRENSKGPEDCRHCSISPFSLAMDCIDQGTRTGCPRG
jgi:hypothetical protein